MFSPREMEMPARTFLNWYKRAYYTAYAFNMRPVSHHPCHKPFVFYFSKANYNDTMQQTLTKYEKHHVPNPECRWKMANPSSIERIEVHKKLDPQLWDRFPRRSCCRVMKSKKKGTMVIHVGVVCRENEVTTFQSLHLNMSRVSKATRNFSETLQIGGGFGIVYRANLDDGLVVAVKRAKREHFKSLRTKFSCEVELLAKIDHRNLLKLLCYIEKGNERILIIEFVPNGTLQEHLDDLFGKILDFNQRLEIAIDFAHGLTYLHLYAGQ
ncbi:hypothetical protein RYX36_002286 [Vicia faba]